MKEPRNIFGTASFALFQKFLPLAFLFATCVIAIPVFALGEKYQIDVLRTLGGILFLIGICASVFTSREILIRIEEDPALLFSDALAHTLYRYLTYLCFLPFIGPVLQRFLEKRRSKNPFTSDE